MKCRVIKGMAGTVKGRRGGWTDIGSHLAWSPETDRNWETRMDELWHGEVGWEENRSNVSHKLISLGLEWNVPHPQPWAASHIHPARMGYLS